MPNTVPAPAPVPAPTSAGVVVPQAVAQLGYQQLELRKRIALQMMMQRQRRAYPQNVGQGLSAVGDAIGDVGTMQMMQRLQAEQDAQRLRQQEELDQQAPRTTVGM